MRHTPPLHTLSNGLRGNFLGVRVLSIRAAIVGLFPFGNDYVGEPKSIEWRRN
jgi:hypothetical protein